MRMKNNYILKINLIIILTLLFCGFNLLFAKNNNTARYKVKAVTNAGKIIGTVTFTGEMPALKPIQVNKDTKVCGKHKPNESLIVDAKSNGVKNAVVFLKGVKSGKKWPEGDKDFAMDQNGCVFSPHVLVVPVAKQFYMLNNDGILHNIHTRSEKNAEINKAQPKFLKKMKLTFNEPEFVKIACDVHNWMNGWIVVADHPYYVVTDENGQFELDGVPAGSYSAEIWHETLGTQTLQVEVKTGEETTLTGVFK